MYKNKTLKGLILAFVFLILLVLFVSHVPGGVAWVQARLAFLGGAEQKIFWAKSFMPDYTIPYIKEETISNIVASLIGLGLSMLGAMGVFSLYKKKRVRRT